jgi:hypothetical protein
MSEYKTPFKSQPSIENIENLLRSYSPEPPVELKVQVAKRSWEKTIEAYPARVFWKPSPAWQFGLVFGVVLLLFILSLFTPFGKGLAQSISQFFRLAPSDTIIETVSLTPIPTPDPGYPYNLYNLAPGQAEKLAGFTVKKLPNVPNGWLFFGARYEAEKEKVSLFYGRLRQPVSQDLPKTDIDLTINQQKSVFDELDWGNCPNGTLKKVTIHGQTAELLDGAVWVTYTQPTPGIKREWTCEQVDTNTVLTLRWQEKGLNYEVNLTQFVGEGSPVLSSEELLQLVETLY